MYRCVLLLIYFPSSLLARFAVVVSSSQNREYITTTEKPPNTWDYNNEKPLRMTSTTILNTEDDLIRIATEYQRIFNGETSETLPFDFVNATLNNWYTLSKWDIHTKTKIDGDHVTMHFVFVDKEYSNFELKIGVRVRCILKLSHSRCVYDTSYPENREALILRIRNDKREAILIFLLMIALALLLIIGFIGLAKLQKERENNPRPQNNPKTWFSLEPTPYINNDRSYIRRGGNYSIAQRSKPAVRLPSNHNVPNSIKIEQTSCIEYREDPSDIAESSNSKPPLELMNVDD